MKRISKKLVCLAIILLLLVWLAPFFVQAETVRITPKNPVNLEVGIGGFKQVTGGIAQYIGQIYWFATAIVGGLAVVMIIIGAVQYSSSAGNKAAIGSAKETMTSAIIGLVIVLMAYLILGSISGDFVNIANPRLKTIEIGDTSFSSVYQGCHWETYTTEYGCSPGFKIVDDKNCGSGGGFGTKMLCCCDQVDKPTDVPTYTYNKCDSNGICITITDSHVQQLDQCDKPDEPCTRKEDAETCRWTKKADAEAECKNGVIQFGEYWCCKPAPPGKCEKVGDWCDPGECCAGLYCKEEAGPDKCFMKW